LKLTRVGVEYLQTKGPRKKRFDLNNQQQMQEFADLKSKIEAWAMSNLNLNSDPPIPKELEQNARSADCYRVLLSIADALGRGDKARAAAIELSKRRMDEPIRVRLLRDIRTVFNQLGIDRIRTDDLLQALLALEECSLEHGEVWSYWTGVNSKQPPHALKKNEMLALLRTFPIRPRTVRYGSGDNDTFNGFMRTWFEPYWTQHCPEDHTATQTRQIGSLS
jgi:hypothetical protein